MSTTHSKTAVVQKIDAKKSAENAATPASAPTTLKAVRKARGEGATVSIAMPRKLYLFLKATARVAGVQRGDVNAVLLTALEQILTANGVSQAELQRELRGDRKEPARNASSPLLDSLFSENPTS